MSATSEHSGVDIAAFEEWLQDGPLDLDVAFRYEHGSWYCLLEQYDITGMGDSERDAFRNALGLLGVYLMRFFVDGRPIADALRPVPRRLKLQIRRDTLLGGVMGRARHRPPNHESKAVILPEQLAGVC